MKIRRTERTAYSFLIVVAIVAVLIEQGIEHGLWILGAIAYMCSLLMVISSLLSSIAMRQLALDRSEILFAVFAVTFAAVALTFARDWFPLGFISAIACLTSFVIWAIVQILIRRRMQ